MTKFAVLTDTGLTAHFEATTVRGAKAEAVRKFGEARALPMTLINVETEETFINFWKESGKSKVRTWE